MTWGNEGAGFDRRELLIRGLQGAGALSAFSLLGACGSSDPQQAAKGSRPAITPGPPKGQPKRGGRLVVAMVGGGLTETLQFTKATVGPDYIRGFAMFDGLYFVGNGGLRPGLAESAEPNKDATVWTLKLRDGVTWHDGKPFTADDVLYTMNTWRDPKESFFAGTAGVTMDLKNVRKLDRLTVEVPLLRPIAELPSLLSWPNAYILQDGFKNWSKPVGTGPFRFQSFKPGSSSTFLANPDYWRGAPYVDELVIDSSYTSDSARLNAVVGGAAGIAANVPPALAKAQAASGIVIGNSPGPGTITPYMRVNVPPFNDSRVVQAFKLLTDREAFVNSVFNGYATVGNGCPCAGLQYWASDIKQAHDPEQAKALLKAAGQENMTMSLVSSEQVPGMDAVATLFASQAAAAGVKVNVKKLPVSTYYTPTSNPGYLTDQRQLAMTYWQSQPSLTQFYLLILSRKASFNETGWALDDAAKDKLIQDAIGETDPAKAKDKWHAVQEQQVKQGGYIIPANTNFVDAYAKHVHNGNTTKWGDNSNYDYTQIWVD